MISFHWKEITLRNLDHTVTEGVPVGKLTVVPYGVSTLFIEHFWDKTWHYHSFFGRTRQKQIYSDVKTIVMYKARKPLKNRNLLKLLAH